MITVKDIEAREAFGASQERNRILRLIDNQKKAINWKSGDFSDYEKGRRNGYLKALEELKTKIEAGE